MNEMFSQGGKGSTGILTNKQAVARHFGVKQSEVVYFSVGAPLTGYKVIYDKESQRAYSLPADVGSEVTAVSLSSAGVLVHSAGSVDLGALAVTRGEFVTLPGSFTSGQTLTVKNELLTYDGVQYCWLGALPKTVPQNSTPATTGGVSPTAWKAVKGDFTTFRRTLNSIVNDPTIALGQSYMISDRADGIFYVEDAATNPANGYSVIALTGVPSLVLKLQVFGNTIDLEQIGGKPYIPGVQEVDCKQALQEAFYLLLDKESATVDLKSNNWLLSSYVFNDVKQRRKIKGDNAVIYGMADDGITNYDYLISTAWNYQDIEGVTLDCRFNPRYACALRITHGYGRYDKITIRKSRCMIQVGIPDTNPMSLSEFMFHQLRGEENAKVAVVHGLYSVLNISDSIIPCGEGAFWKSYDCTGFTVYGGRVFLVKCGGNSNVHDGANPYVYLANSTVSGSPYIGSFSAVQCDFEFRTPFCIVQDNTTVYQNYNQAVVLDACRIGVFSSLDARANNFFSSNVGYRGSLVIKNSDILFDTAVTTAPIVAGGHTLVDIDFDNIYIPGLRGYKMVSWVGYPPLMPSTIVFQSSIGSPATQTGGIFVPFTTPIVDLSGDTRVCSQNWDVASKKFLTPVSGLSDVVATARITLTENATANVSVLIEANVGSGGIGIATGVIPIGQKSITLVGNIGDLPPNAQLYVITDSTASYTLSNTGAYDTYLSIQATIRSPKTRS